MPPWRLQPLASHYFKLHIVLHCLQSVEMLFVAEIESPTNVKEVNEGCHALFSKHLTFQKCLNLTEQENCINNNSQFDLSGVFSSCHLVNHISPDKICRAIRWRYIVHLLTSPFQRLVRCRKWWAPLVTLAPGLQLARQRASS